MSATTIVCQIAPGKSIVEWKGTPGPSQKSYDFWEHVIAAFASDTKSLGADHALNEVEWVSLGTAFSWFMQGRFGFPWGTLVKLDDPYRKAWVER